MDRWMDRQGKTGQGKARQGKGSKAGTLGLAGKEGLGEGGH